MPRKAPPPKNPTGLYHAREFRQMSQDQLARLSGVGKSQISKLERAVDEGGRELTRAWAERFADHLRLPAERIVFWDRYGPPDDEEDTGEIAPKERRIPIIGFVGAGSEAYFFPAGELDTVPAPDGSSKDTVAVEIRGTSLGELFDRWLVFYDDVRRPVTADLLGRLCVVGLADGRVLVKRVQRGRGPGLFNLYSQHGETIRDVALEWGARVKHMAPT